MFFVLKEIGLFFGEFFYHLKLFKQSAYFYKKVYYEGFNKDECIEHILSCYTSLFDFDSVIYFCDDYLGSGDKNPNVYYFKAQALSCKGMYDGALKYYDLALKEDSENLIILISRSDVLFKLEEDDLFLEACDEILNLDPNNFHILYNKSVFYFNKEKWKLALEFVNKSLAVEGGNLNALSTKSKIFIKMGLLDEAMETLDILLAIYPNSVEDLMNKSFVLLKKEYYSQAETCLDKVLKLDSTNEEALKIKEDLQKNNDY